MKKLYTILPLLAFHSVVFAQPANDDCAGAQIVTPNGTCYTGTTMNANDNWQGTVGCQSGNNHPEVWYKFVATGTTLNVNVTAGTLTGNIEFVLVGSSGPCTGLINVGSLCGPSPLMGPINGLVAGNTYYYTISSSTSSQGTFTTCVTNTATPPSPGQDCGTSAIICNSNPFPQGTYTGIGVGENIAANSCFQLNERQSKWYKFTIGCDGTLGFVINPSTSTDDYDWAIWNTSLSPCAMTMPAPVACNWSGCPGATGLSPNPLSEPNVSICTGPGACGGGPTPKAFCNEAAANQSLLNVTAGTVYTILVDNYTANGNGFNFSFRGTAKIGPDATFTSSQTGCLTYDFQKSCPTANSTFLWQFGDGSTALTQDASHTYLVPGTYIVTLEVKDILGCIATFSQTINVTGPTVSVNSLTICAGQSATLTATPSAGGGTYSWSPGGQTTSSITVSPASTTTYTVTYNLGGCSNTGSGTVTVNAAPTVTVNSQTICAGQSATLTATPSTGGGTYSWSPGGQTTSSITVSPASTTTYTVTYNLGGCSNTGSGTVTVNAAPTVTVNSQTICAGQSATLTATPSTGGGTYSWSPGGQTTSSITVSPVSTTTYTVTYNLGGCSNTGSGTVTVNSVTPAVNISATTTSICSGNPITFTATPTNGGTTPTYQWQVNGVNAGTNSATFTSSSLANNDQVTVMMTSNASCATTSTATSNVVTITTSSVTPSVSINASSTSICAGSSITFTATPTNGGSTPTYQWQVNGANAGTNSATLTSSSLANNDQITVIMTSNASCTTTSTATSNVITIATSSVTPSVSINASSTSICAGSSITFTATPTNGGTTPTYQWQVNGVNAGTNSPTFTSSSLANNDQVTVIMTSNASCTTTSTATSNVITITTSSVTPSVSINASSTSICTGGSITFTATPTNGGTTPTYQWQVNGVNAGTNSPIFTSSSLANNDQVTVIMTSNVSCATTSTATSNVITTTASSVTPSVSINASSTSICAGSSITFTATPTNGGSTPTYQWQVNGVNAGTNSATFTSGSLANNDQVTVIMTSNASCAATSTATSNVITITASSVTPSVSINASSTSICAGSSITFTATPTNGGTTPTYQWQVNGVNVPGQVSSTFTSTSLSTGDIVTAIMTSNNSCTSPPAATSNGVTVSVTAPVPGIRYKAVTATPNIPLQLQARALGNNYSYQWIPPVGLNFSNIKDPVFDYDKQTEYLIRISSGIGCITVDTLLVNIVNTPSVFVPNAWTPNGDGHNDYLFPLTINVTQLKYFRVFNRWGQKVFETNIIGNGWDGNFNGKPQPIDVYVWTVEAVSSGGFIYKTSGRAVLLR